MRPDLNTECQITVNSPTKTRYMEWRMWRDQEFHSFHEAQKYTGLTYHFAQYVCLSSRQQQCVPRLDSNSNRTGGHKHREGVTLVGL